jgi:hypothetical protein
LQWLHNTSQNNVDNLNAVKAETNRHFGKKNSRVSLKVILISLKKQREQEY